MSVNKRYNWECVVWVKTLGDIQRIRDFGVKGYISPVHNMDGGDSHYHVIWCFDRQQTYDSVMSMIKEEGLDDCINTVKYVKDLTSRARYLCHLDEKHKYHYSTEDVECMGGLSYSKFLDYTKDSADSDLTLFGIIDKYKVKSYAQLVKYCAYVEKDKYANVVGRCSFWSAYIKSLAFDIESPELNYIINEKRGIRNV